MARVLVGNRGVFLGRGISYYHIDDNANTDRTDVVRVHIPTAKPFIIGSITGAITQGNPDRVINRTLDSFVNRVNTTTQFDIRLPGNIKLRPMWISNGTFFATHEQVRTSVAGTVVFQGQPGWNPAERLDVRIDGDPFSLTPPPVPRGAPRPQKDQRWTYLQGDGGLNEQVRFFHEEGLRRADNIAPRWYSAISGAGALVETITFAGTPTTYYRGLPLPAQGRSKYWENNRATGNFANAQTYCAGPVIAMNAAGTALYLIMDRTNSNGETDSTRQGRRWEHMTAYLQGSSGHGNFLNEIRFDGSGTRPNDGRVGWAYVYDGGGSRQLWIGHPQRGIGPPRFNQGLVAAYPGGSVRRTVPHFICLWGRVP